ncbi:PgaD family protein [Macrococcus animalis]|uniref:PgaD family protein n=1 Tax=Macrococcus animalis TaxID=3395467 RepID=UPI0039BDFDF6
MDKSRQRKQRSELIIKTKKNWFFESFLSLLSIIIWIYVVYAMLFYVTSFLNISIDQVNILKIILNIKNMDVIKFTWFVISFFVFVFILLLLWASYNKWRFGPLKRRKYPSPTSVQDIIDLDYITSDIYNDLQNAKMITFEKNPITDRNVD